MTHYRNKKTGGIYRHLAIGIDTTNERDGTMVVIYCKDDDENLIFVREQEEFELKFEPIE